MTIHPLTSYIISLVAGILILIFPTILNYIVGLYLILMGLIGILTRVSM
ncbi:MAG: DUF3096 domain-containing protein [Chlamydiae bacterium]|nr:DUF3096 domain-containing protein [Chlamydiota bacterium]